MAKSVVLLNTGDGKGKSSAAFGVVMRSVAAGRRVAVVQFLKGPKWKTGEEKVGRELGVDWYTLGDGFTWESDDLAVTEEVNVAAWQQAKALLAAGEHDLVVLDEVTYLSTFGWVAASEVAETVRQRPVHVDVVMTGRDATTEMIDVADTVTEMTKVKHAFDAGIIAKRGIEY